MMTDRVVYSHILKYLDITPIDTTSVQKYEDQYHWLQRLTSKGFYSKEGITNYKAIYILLSLNAFDTKTTFIRACENNLEEAVNYISDYVDQDALLECVMKTSSPTIVKGISIDESNLTKLLVAVSNNRSKVANLLGDAHQLMQPRIKVTNENMANVRLLLHSQSSDIVALNIDSESIRAVALDCSPQASNVFDSRGYVYPIDYAIKYNLANSVTNWLSQTQTQLNLKTRLLECILTNKEVGGLIVKHIRTSDLSAFVKQAIISNNYDILTLLPYTSRDLSLAISLGITNSVRAMVSVATKQHLAQCIKQGRTKEYLVLSLQ